MVTLMATGSVQFAGVGPVTGVVHAAGGSGEGSWRARLRGTIWPGAADSGTDVFPVMGAEPREVPLTFRYTAETTEARSVVAERVGWALRTGKARSGLESAPSTIAGVFSATPGFT